MAEQRRRTKDKSAKYESTIEEERQGRPKGCTCMTLQT